METSRELPADEFQMTPTPAGLPPQAARTAANRHLFGRWADECKREKLDPKNDGLMRTVCAHALTLAAGRPVEVITRSALTTQQLEIIAAFLEEHGIPRHLRQVAA